MAYSFGRFALNAAAPVTSAVGVCPCEPATGATTDERETLELLLILTGRVDGVKVDVRAPLALRIEAEA